MNIQDLQALYQKNFNRQLTPQDIQALGGQNGAWTQMTPTQFQASTINPSAEFTKNQPVGSTVPKNATALQTGIIQSQNAFNPLMQAKNAMDANTYNTLKQNIAYNKANAEKGVSETLSSRGLERSGELGADVGLIEQTAQQSLDAAAIQNALNDAQNIADNFTQVTSNASQISQNSFQNQLAVNAQNFTQWLGTQNLDIGLFSNLPTAYNTLLTMQNAPDPTLYNELVKIAGNIGGTPPAGSTNMTIQ